LTQHSPAHPDLTARKRNPRQTHDRLVRAALELFTTRGYHETTTPLIAARAGVAEGTIYRHFASKDELLNEIYRAGTRLFTGIVRETDPGARCRDRLQQVGKRWRELASREPALVRLVFSDQFAALADEKTRAASRELHTELEKLIAAGKAAGDVRPGSAELWTELWLRLALLVLERVARGTWKADDPAIQQVFDAAWDTIRAAPTDRGSDRPTPVSPSPAGPR
jgi:AcrR family transcriptional regulator